MSDHSHPHSEPAPAASAPLTPDDAGSQALAEALRSSFAIVKFVMVALVVVFFGSGFFQVGPQEKAIILRFGKAVGQGQQALLGPGLHWSFPYPIDEVVRIPITEVQMVSSTVGWYYMTREQEIAYKTTGIAPPASATLNPAMDGYLLTADRNIIHARATLYYHVDDPIRYVFSFTSASNAIQNALDNAVFYTAAHFQVDDALYNERAAFQDDVLQRADRLVEQERLGIAIDHCVLDDIVPPRQLKAIFDQVTEAEQNRNKLLDDAHSYENQVTNSAAAQGAAGISEARSARTRYVQSVQADAKAFSALLPNYLINPALFEQQKLVQVVGQAMTNANFKAFLPTTANGEPIEVRLMLNREPPGPKSPGSP
jgi:membrane protease subunit HflK